MKYSHMYLDRINSKAADLELSPRTFHLPLDEKIEFFESSLKYIYIYFYSRKE
jgi:hypothetical protein